MSCIVDELECPDCPPRHEHNECGWFCEQTVRSLSTPKGHEAVHNASKCETCKAPRHIAERTHRCINGCCTVIKCGRCGKVGCSWGPVGCDCGEETALLPKLNRRSSRRWRAKV